LEHPISVGWVLLKILETIWRLLLILGVLIALGGIALWLSERNPLSSKVRVELSSPTDCPATGYPIQARIMNRSSKTLGEVDVQLRVYPQGKSEDVASYLSARHELHYVLRPREELEYCFAMPQLEPGSTGPYTVTADVSYASEVSKDVPVGASEPPPVVRIAASNTHRSTPRSQWAKVGDIVSVLICLALFGSGGYGFVLLFDRTFKTELRKKLLEGEDSNNQSGLYAIVLAAGINTSIVVIGSYALAAFGWDGWVTDIDTWSRSRGFADGGIMLVTALICQWPWALLAVLQRSHLNDPAKHGGSQ